MEQIAKDERISSIENIGFGTPIERFRALHRDFEFAVFSTNVGPAD